MNKPIKLQTKLWAYHGKATWHFLSIPPEESAQIKFENIFNLRGWGSLKVTAKIGKTKWKTSIFPDSKTSSYLLPIKALVRKSEKLIAGDIVDLELLVGEENSDTDLGL
jgi:hypothetical protein